MWAAVPKERRRLATIWLLEDNGFVAEWKSVARKNRVKMLGVEATLATRERAQALGLNYESWQHVMYDGCLADSAVMSRKARRISRILGGDSGVHVTSSNGTDLRFKLDKRPIEYSDGTVSPSHARNGRVVFLPSGAVGTTVDEKSAEGTIVYDNPLPFPGGRVEGFKLRLEKGRIMTHGGGSNADKFWKYVASWSEGDFDRFGYFGIGLNPRLRFGYTQDDKVLGSVELNFGENRSRGGKNRGERNWWGAVYRPSIFVGDRLIMKGRLLS